jgi:predicted lipoprotein with Yx(FWY)xxD motif
MTRSRSHTFLAGAAALALIALAAIGCGGGYGPPEESTPPTTPSGDRATIGTATNGGVGSILVDSNARTLYLFERDAGTASTCFGACASDWPPLLESHMPTVGSGADASIVGTTARSDGPRQVTYNGHPLYLYAGDENPGDTEGQGVTAFGGAWYALTPAGDEVSGDEASSDGGYGY